jgi:PQQ enzyme repeat
MYIAPGADHIGELQAWSVDTGQKVWSHPFEKSQLWGPVLVTAGNVVFTGGTNDRYFRAFDATNGKALWQFRTSSGVNGVPVSFQVDGKQYVAVQSGWGVDAARTQARLNLARPWEYRDVPQGGVCARLAGPSSGAAAAAIAGRPIARRPGGVITNQVEKGAFEVVGAGFCDQAGGRRIAQHLAFVQYDDPVEISSLVAQMSGPQNRDFAPVTHAAHQAQQVAPAAGIQTDGGLVHQQHAGLVQQGAGEFDPAAVAAAQIAYRIAGAVGQIEAVELVGDPLLGEPAGQPVQAGVKQ